MISGNPLYQKLRSTTQLRKATFYQRQEQINEDYHKKLSAYSSMLKENQSGFLNEDLNTNSRIKNQGTANFSAQNSQNFISKQNTLNENIQQQENNQHHPNKSQISDQENSQIKNIHENGNQEQKENSNQVNIEMTNYSKMISFQQSQFSSLYSIKSQQQNLTEQSKLQEDEYSRNFIRQKTFSMQSKINILWESKQYNPDKAPPDIQKAQMHGKSQRVCEYIDYCEYSKEKCECCGKAINNQLLPLCSHPNQLNHIGTAYPLYFVFIKQCFIFIAIHMLIQSIPALVIYSKGTFCDKASNSTFICKLSFLNIIEENGSKNLNTLAILNFVALLLQLLVIEVFKVYQRGRVRLFEEYRKSVSYYSIILKKLPSIENLEQKIEQFLENQIPETRDQIARVFILYDLKEYDDTQIKRKNMFDQKNRSNLNLRLIPENQKLSEIQKQNQIELNQNLLEEAEKEIEVLDKKLEDLSNKLLEMGEIKFNGDQKNANGQVSLNESKLNFSGRMLITFKTHQVAQKVIKYFKKRNGERFLAKNHKIFKSLARKRLDRFYLKEEQTGDEHLIDLKVAPEPSDIMWTSLSSVSNKSKQRIYANLLIFLAMMGALAIIVIFKLIIRDRSQNYSTFWKLVMNLIAASLVAGANVIIGITIRKMASKEQRTTYTSYFIQVGRKLTYMFMVNMLLTILFANLFAQGYIKGINNNKLKIPLDVLNMVGEYFFLFITNSYISSIMSIFDIMWGVRLLKRYILKNKVKDNRSTTSQQDANNLFEGHPIDMALRYANVLKVVLYTSATSVLLPIGAPMCLIGIFIIYWADKFLLYRRMVCSNYISTILSKKMLEVFHLSTIFFALGNIFTLMLPQYNTFETIVNQSTLDTQYIILSLIGLIIAIVLHVLPVQKASLSYLYVRIYQKFYTKSELEEEFQQLKDIIIDDYDLYHPASRDQRLESIQKQDLSRQMKQKLQVIEEEEDKTCKNNSLKPTFDQDQNSLKNGFRISTKQYNINEKQQDNQKNSESKFVILENEQDVKNNQDEKQLNNSSDSEQQNEKNQEQINIKELNTEQQLNQSIQSSN